MATDYSPSEGRVYSTVHRGELWNKVLKYADSFAKQTNTHTQWEDNTGRSEIVLFLQLFPCPEDINPLQCTVASNPQNSPKASGYIQAVVKGT